MNDTTLGWRDVLSIGRGMWDDVTRCRLAAGDWGVALAVHPGFGGPQSVLLCGDQAHDGPGGFLECAAWRTGFEARTGWPLDAVRHGGALVTRGPLTVWRRRLPGAEVDRLHGELLDLGVASLDDVPRGDGGGMQALSGRVYFREGSYDHSFAIGPRWREPGQTAHRELLRLFAPHLKPSLRLYFSES